MAALVTCACTGLRLRARGPLLGLCADLAWLTQPALPGLATHQPAGWGAVDAWCVLSGTLDSSESSGQSGTLQTDSGQSSTGLGSSLGSLTISGSGPNDSRPSSSGRGRGSRGGRPQSSPPPGSLQ